MSSHNRKLVPRVMITLHPQLVEDLKAARHALRIVTTIKRNREGKIRSAVRKINNARSVLALQLAAKRLDSLLKRLP